jgi:hypothetical protein
MLSHEARFRRRYPDCRLEIERVSEWLTYYRVFVGALECSESAVREWAFRYAMEDIRGGRLRIPRRIIQLELPL